MIFLISIIAFMVTLFDLNSINYKYFVDLLIEYFNLYSHYIDHSSDNFEFKFN
jgi:hypothetical protein